MESRVVSEVPKTVCLERLRPVLVRVAYRLVWNHDDAEEIAQDAILRWLSGNAARGDEASLRGWLLRAVVHCAMERQRKRRRWRGVRERLRWRASTEAPSDAVVLDESLERLRRHILALPPKQQAAVTLRDIEDCSYAEIAMILGVTEPTVRGHVFAARERLRKRMNRTR